MEEKNEFLFEGDLQDAAVASLVDRFKHGGMNDELSGAFRALIYDYYQKHERSFSWRQQITPYRVVVSEIMLQQTQVHRVAQKFDDFVAQLPDFHALAQAPLSQVLALWSGLGYNRRARALHQIAKKIVQEYNGLLPNQPAILQTFPGIGPATAASITAFAYNVPTIFVETNIRTVFFYFFFKGCQNITDEQLLPLIAQTVDQQNPRAWYYALMDYGTMLKKTVGNLNVLSKHYHRQSQFKGSDRQIRGMVLRMLLSHGPLCSEQLIELCQRSAVRVERIVQDLVNEKFIHTDGNLISLIHT